MKFFFPDSSDLVDPSFDFRTESRSRTRIRQRDDLYAHEIFDQPPYNGLLVSKAIVDGNGGASGRYTLAQRQRLLRTGVRAFFRLDSDERFSGLETMGDCGAFSYVREQVPPFSAEDDVEFYEQCGFDYGLSVDHVILGYQNKLDGGLAGVNIPPPEWKARQELTLELAREFYGLRKRRGSRFKPIGVAQGWSPHSYAAAVKTLQKIGYNYIALGGLVPLKNHEIIECVEAANSVRRSKVKFHLLGVTRCEHVNQFVRWGVASFDSTSPLRQAFKDDRDNYYTLDRTYVAIRVPQVDGNPRLQRQIRAGEVSNDAARRLEAQCLQVLDSFDRELAGIEEVVSTLRDYGRLIGESRARDDAYREVLTDRPWKDCPCRVCKDLGIHVILFRGAERNRRRGFHNIEVFYRRLHRGLGLIDNAMTDQSHPNTAVLDRNNDAEKI